jgi:hypothetical protein
MGLEKAEEGSPDPDRSPQNLSLSLPISRALGSEGAGRKVPESSVYSVGVLASIARWKRETRPKKIDWSREEGLESLERPRDVGLEAGKEPLESSFRGSSFLAWNSWLKVGVLTENTGRFDPLRMGFGLLVLLRGENGKFPDPSLVGYWACRLAVWAYAANLVWLLAPHLRKDLDLLVGMWGEGRIGWETLVQRTEELACRAKSWAARGRRLGRVRRLSRSRSSGPRPREQEAESWYCTILQASIRESKSSGASGLWNRFRKRPG